MIKVNLLKSIGGVKNSSSSESVALGADGDLPLTRSAQIKKIVLVFLPIVLVLGFREYEKYQARQEVESLEKNIAQVNSQLKALEPAVKEVERYKEEQTKLQNQLGVIKGLSRERLKNAKSLEALQTIIPQRAWLTKFKVMEEKVEIDGIATDEAVVSDFINDLEKSIYFAQVTLIGTEEAKKDNSIVKKFSLRCNLENL